MRVHGLILAAAITVAALAGGCDASESPRAGSGDADSKGKLEGLRVEAKIALLGEPMLLAVAGDKLWVSFNDDGSVAAVDPATNRIGPRKRLANGAATQLDNPLAGSRSHLWAADNANDQVHRVDARSGAVELAVDVEHPIELTTAFGSVWIAQFDAYKVIRLERNGKRIAARISASGPTDVKAGGGSIWVLAHRSDEILRIDPGTNRVTASIPLMTAGSTPERIAFGEGALWVSDPPGNSVTRVNPLENRVGPEIVMPVRLSYPFHVATGGGYVWVQAERHVFRIDPRTNTVTGVARLSTRINPEFGALTDVEYAFGSVWVVNRLRRQLVRLRPTGGRQ